jgi:hypothetical protein
MFQIVYANLRQSGSFSGHFYGRSAPAGGPAFRNDPDVVGLADAKVP